MCGIAGLFRPGGVDTEPLGRMVRLLAHRGPDDEGIERVQEPGEAAPWAGVGVRRLAIVDPPGGHQPLRDASGRWLVCLNGEVYNHRRIRQELAANGVPFRTTSDTEVVANLVAVCGLRGALERLHGMFALSVVDTATRTVHLARDRMGQKPLYWAQLADGTLAWSSEVRSLAGHPGLPRREDRRALQAFLLWEYVPTPWTAWQGVHKAEPGTFLTADAQGVRVTRFWTPPVPQPGNEGSLDRWARSLHGALQVAVHQRMEADVEVGFLLSGGLDSTAVVALAQARQDRPVRTFSVAVDAPGFDEGPAARRAAASLGTEHREARLEPGDLGRILGEIARHVDEPLADSSLVATWRLMELVREAGLKCVLSGDGADESFAGYPTYLAHRLAGPAAPARRLLGPLARRLRTSYEGVSRDYMARRFVQGLGLPWQRRHQHWMGAWLPEEIGAPEAVWEIVDHHAAACADTDVVSRALYLDQRMYLSDGVLVKVDRASMAQGVEVRSPFLDHAVVELAASMPVGMKLRGRQGKVVLRRALADRLPPETLSRRKQGFGTPTGPWLRGPCRGLLDGLPDALVDLVPPDLVRRCVAEHLEGRADHRRRLWSALVLARWREFHG